MLYYYKEKSAVIPEPSSTSKTCYPGMLVYSTAAPKIDFDYKTFNKADYKPIEIVDDTINAPSERITGDDDIKDVFDSLTSGNGR